jgi:hypothetical protein
MRILYFSLFAGIYVTKLEVSITNNASDNTTYRTGKYFSSCLIKYDFTVCTEKSGLQFNEQALLIGLVLNISVILD